MSQVLKFREPGTKLTELQPVPTPVVATVGHTMSTRDLAVLVEQEYQDQKLTPAMRMLLTRVGVFL